MYNKSDIMKAAWKMYRQMEGKWTFSAVLKVAWRNAKYAVEIAKTEANRIAAEVAKKTQKYIKVNELKAGDVVKIDYGGEGFLVTCTVVSIDAETEYNDYWCINAIANNTELKFFSHNTDMLHRSAA